MACSLFRSVIPVLHDHSTPDDIEQGTVGRLVKQIQEEHMADGADNSLTVTSARLGGM